jgi:hypothetical protein
MTWTNGLTSIEVLNAVHLHLWRRHQFCQNNLRLSLLPRQDLKIVAEYWMVVQDGVAILVQICDSSGIGISLEVSRLFIPSHLSN